ncbi:integrase family protein [Aliiroseovarius sp. xm-g-7]|uniref:tyrosine-type recombinase/integrase n=1 Tax=Aliiroseovarius sp. xm-g-7 TaxID=2651826 RepID=UPI001568A591|nr:integrase family protein [Aliiroseovarius sp. xm-g-7]NRQ26953.1 Tyrosine recombinase XerC [Aliiroseovarius sp. xm-g-7]
MTENKRKLSDHLVTTVKAQDKTYNIWDTQQPGLFLQVSPKGKTSWRVKYRIGKGKSALQKIVTLEDPRYLTCDEARAQAAELYYEGKKGIDVAHLWKQEQQEQVKASITRALDEDYGLADTDNPAFLKTAWITAISLKPKLSPRYERNLYRLWKHIADRYGDNIKTEEMTVEKIARIKREMEGTKSEFNKFRAMLFSTMRNEVYEGRIQKNPVEKVKAYTAKVRQVFLSPKGIKQFKEFYSNHENVKPHQINIARYFLCLLMTGQRPTMIRTLQKKDDGENNFVDFKRNCVVFREHKTDESSEEQAVVIPVSDEVIEIMHKAKNVNPENPYIFCSHDMRRKYNRMAISETRAQELFQENAHRFDVEGYGDFEMYCLRHTFGTHLTAQGVPITVVGKMMMHSSITTTMRYAKATEQGKLEAVDVVRKVL